MEKTSERPRTNRAILAILAILAAIGLMAAWEALANYGELIALVYAGAAIVSALAWAALFVVRVVYGVRERHADHGLRQAETMARQLTVAAEASLAQARAMAEARKLSAEARKAEREAELLTIIAKRDEQVLIADDDRSRKFTAAHLQLSGQVNGVQIQPTPEQIKAWTMWHGPRSQATAAPLIQEAAAPPTPPEPIIPALVERQRILIVGASDSGKTTLLRWLIDARRNTGQKCLVIDPHGSPAKWGENTMQIGRGLRYADIAAALPRLLAEMERRHGDIGSGEVLEGQHEQFTIIIDEFRGIVKHCQNAGEQIGELLTDGRKTGLNLIVASHSRYVKALGLEGEGDLRKGYVIVELHGGQGEDRRASLEFNADGNKIPYALPGPHPDLEAAKLKAKAAEKIETDLESILSEEPESEPELEPTPAGYDPDRAEQIRTMYNEGKTKTEIARHFGYKSNAGAIFHEIKAALEDAETATTTTKPA